jgi:hypothetical protein
MSRLHRGRALLRSALGIEARHGVRNEESGGPDQDRRQRR